MAGTLVIDTLKSSTTSPPTFQNTNGTEIGTLCRAWVNFNGTTSPGTIRAQFNVSSVTKNGTGDYTVNFSTAMPDANYSVVATGMRNIAEGTSSQPVTVRPYNDTVYGNVFTTASVRLKSTVYSGSVDDVLAGTVAIFR